MATAGRLLSAAAARATRARGPALQARGSVSASSGPRPAPARGRLDSAILARAGLAPEAVALMSWLQLRAASRKGAPASGPSAARARPRASGAEGEEAALPDFQTRVRQLVAGGDIRKVSDWASQDLGLATIAGGNLCCTGAGAGTVQVYHRREDLAKARVEAVPLASGLGPFCFCVEVPGSQPVIFAAASPAFQDLWMEELAGPAGTHDRGR